MKALTLAPKTIRSSPKAGRPQLCVTSTAALALVLYVILNAVFYPVARAFPDSNGTTRVVAAFRSPENVPEIVILGSSVAKHVYGAIPKVDVQRRKISNLSFNLQVVSDGFILSDKLLIGPKQPKLVVLCVCPRDFIDHDIKDVTRTTTFRKIVTLADFPRLASVLDLSFFDCARAAYSNLCCFYDERAAVQEHLKARTVAAYKWLGTACQQKPEVEDLWTHSLREYAWRYEGISTTKLAPQMSTLRQTVELCKSRGMKVVLVNLPMSRDNLDLLPIGFYTDFCGRLKQLSSEGDCQFIDCGSSKQIAKVDFVDCAHLNSEGGQKVFAMLRPTFDELSNRNISAWPQSAEK